VTPRHRAQRFAALHEKQQRATVAPPPPLAHRRVAIVSPRTQGLHRAASAKAARASSHAVARAATRHIAIAAAALAASATALRALRAASPPGCAAARHREISRSLRP